ncbi:hypothetical protein CI610_01857 [invertebrate metagenome]|uniref:Uncharacterized protein n=1 Tax=invertebrate metagenome TaxID=1711999 RepID=A0A2H9T7I7_9ZZZZ
MEIAFRLALFSPPKALDSWREPVQLLLQKIWLDYQPVFIDDKQINISFYEWISGLGKTATDDYHQYNDQEPGTEDRSVSSQALRQHFPWPELMKKCFVRLEKINIQPPEISIVPPEPAVDKKQDAPLQNSCISSSNDQTSSLRSPEDLDFSNPLFSPWK